MTKSIRLTPRMAICQGPIERIRFNAKFFDLTITDIEEMPNGLFRVVCQTPDMAAVIQRMSKPAANN